MPTCHPTRQWKPIKGFVGYEVSSEGQIRRSLPGRRTFVGRIRSQHEDLYGYKKISLYQRGERIRLHVHIIVAEAFLGQRPKNKEVNHKNGNHKDNRIQNLEWITHQENILHAFQVLGRGNHRRGEKNHISKLRECDVISIRTLYGSGRFSYRKLAVRFSITHQAIRSVVKRDTWKHIE